MSSMKLFESMFETLEREQADLSNMEVLEVLCGLITETLHNGAQAMTSSKEEYRAFMELGFTETVLILTDMIEFSVDSHGK